ncbi:MAG TPA: ABC transporter permease [Exilispira sp.]|nr:ABC transporter permease [Exilispira sp.]HOV45628.1 ABC transporter permease [Exilispira sp.]HQJ40274.1 ABC transporter permease [Exilispira sp.]HQQ19470.1 ABC transporter permease [Exilispira sp.]
MKEFLALFNIDLLTGTIRLSIPIILASIGATICERSGIVNIAMEGVMIVGAFFSTIFTLATNNPWLGLIAGVTFAMLFSLIHAVASVSLHLDHVVSGAVLNIIALGLTRYLMILIIGHPGTTDLIKTSLQQYKYAIPVLSKIPILGPLFFNQTPIIYITFILVIVITIMMNKTKLGLHIKAAGEHPLALETLGISVAKMRYIAVIMSGFLCGLAGSYLAIENGTSFTEGMTNGRGFIAIAANISGGWTPIGAFLSSLLFGFADSLQFKLQASKIISLPSEVFTMFPYILTIILVAGFVRKSRPPKALGVDFMIEKSN